MKLYFSPGACSLSPHIALLEAGLPFTLEMASTKTHQLKDGTDFYTINPLGYVPVLELDNGQRLREGPAIVQYIADQAPASKLAPANGTFERYQLQEWLGFIGTEIHKGFSPLFNPNMPDPVKDMARGQVLKRLTWVDAQLAGKEFLMGADFSVADAYLFTVCGWSKFVGVDISGLENLASFLQRVGARPSVQKAIADEKQ
ncbi:glutathione transferase GstA [Comamonas squillarum]|jgi:glutathione S-transferase|uniref:Glutathione transferase GstA n=1 Tax=Comamonas squillarum TaxID=2977320 RepID=A0ABY5ZTI9_9BURK|nr:glutathione transferase GstA [Comamonas sp. PR12]UXC17287.1 glutathione transferase GstA [Comamonas sp. PR12]